MRPSNIYEYIEDLYELEKVLTKNDELIIIMKDEPNDTMVKLLRNLWEQERIFVVVFNIKRLQFNILEHSKATLTIVPDANILISFPSFRVIDLPILNS